MRLLVHSFLLGFVCFLCSACAGPLRQVPSSFERLPSFDPEISRQVIEVVSSGKSVFQAKLTAWTYDKGVWHKTFGPWPAVIGRNGFAPLNAKREGDGRTPSGLYFVGVAFGRAASLVTGLDYRQATDSDVWIDDSSSFEYNRWVNGVPQAVSHEKMLRSDGLYDLGAVIAYNTDPVIPGNGSAIFIHIWREHGRKPTAGCVALGQDRLSRLLAWMDKEMKPVVLLNP